MYQLTCRHEPVSLSASTISPLPPFAISTVPLPRLLLSSRERLVPDHLFGAIKFVHLCHLYDMAARGGSVNVAFTCVAFFLLLAKKLFAAAGAYVVIVYRPSFQVEVILNTFLLLLCTVGPYTYLTTLEVVHKFRQFHKHGYLLLFS